MKKGWVYFHHGELCVENSIHREKSNAPNDGDHWVVAP